MRLLSLGALVGLLGCSHGSSQQPPADGPLGARSKAQFVGRCGDAQRTGVLHTAEELAESLGACRLDPRMGELDWTRWSVVATTSGSPKLRGNRVVATSKRTKLCDTGQPPPPLFGPPPEPGEPIVAYYYVVPSRVQTVETQVKVKKKRCPRHRGGQPPV